MASQSTIGIIGAMDVEVALLKKQMQECGEVHTTAFSSMEFIEGAIGQTSVVVVKCGVGMVNAATCTQILIDRFGVGAVLNTGIAGSLDASINIGDIVVADDAVNHIMDVRNLGDNFEKQRIVETFGAKCCEMEGAAIAQVAWANGVPCAIVRAVSDKADGSSSMDYPTFEAQAARNSAALVIAMLERQG